MSIEYDSRPAWRNYWFPILIGLLSLPVFGIGALILLWVIIQRYGNRYYVEKSKIESRAGIISKELRSIRLENLRDVHLKQSVMQRLFSVGDLAFSSSGQSTQEVIFSGICAPQALKDLIEDYLHQRAQAALR
jgi:uncharacterized membrane protein YdbT with pleckstrin-like domain